MHIRQFSDKTGLSPDTLRYYEKEGLLTPGRNAAGYRIYGARDAEWVAFILRLKEAGMPLADIKTYARLRDQGDSTIAERYAMLLEHHKRLAEKQQKLAEHQMYLDNKLRIYREMMGNI